jgi:DNA-directed RNA polymerase subunit RPC12/RpoP
MSNNRKKYTENENILLYNEVDGQCPICSVELMYKKKEKSYKKFEIAHIYPLNPTSIEKILLKDEEKLSLDLNDLKNVICLCVDCHTKFDRPRTIKEYKEMVQIKKKIIKTNEERTLWSNHNIETSINKIIEMLVSKSDFEDEENINLTYDPKKIDDKTNETITVLTKRKIKRNVEDYFLFIKKKFNEVDKLQPVTSEVIASQIKTYYLKMKQHYKSQKDIFDGLVNWLNIKTDNVSVDASEIIISYFVQNCEVFE